MLNSVGNPEHWAELVEYLAHEADVTEPGAEFFVIVMTQRDGGRVWRSEGMDYYEFRDEDEVFVLKTLLFVYSCRRSFKT